jgi:hypothetical protein
MPVIKREEDDVPLEEISGGWGAPREDGEEDEQMYDPDAAPFGHEESSAQPASTSAEGEFKPQIKPEDDDALATTGQELLVSRGMASTLSMLRHQGLVKTRTPEDLAREKELKEREAWLSEQRSREREREKERLESRKAGDQKGQQQREYENRQRETRDAQASLEAFSNYKPVVNLTYHDEFGRDMTPKEVRFFFSLYPSFPFLPLTLPFFLPLLHLPTGLETPLSRLPRSRFRQQKDRQASQEDRERTQGSEYGGGRHPSFVSGGVREEGGDVGECDDGIGSGKQQVRSTFLFFPPFLRVLTIRLLSLLLPSFQLRSDPTRHPRQRHKTRQNPQRKGKGHHPSPSHFPQQQRSRTVRHSRARL